MFTRLLAGLLAIFAALSSVPASADPADIAAAARGVVRVIIVAENGETIMIRSHGTGFSVGEERIVTNAHVVREAAGNDRLAIGLVPADGGDAVYARLLAISPRNDLALLETTTPMRLPPITVAANPPTGSGAVTAIGYPANVDLAQGLSDADFFRPQPPVTSTGFLSGTRPSREFDTLLHTAPIGRGNSGGPLVDDCGRLVGVNSFGAESQGTDAEFFFAISNRELLPFLRANNVQPRLNGLPCRSIAELNAAQREREDRERVAEEARAAAEAEREEARAEELRRTILYTVLEERSSRQFLALVAFILAAGAAGIAWQMHQKGDNRARAIAGAIAIIALIAALAAWLTRPSFADIETRLEEQLREEPDEDGEEPVGIIATPKPDGDAATLTCVLDLERSRVIGAAEDDVPIAWGSDGCVNGRTQYGLSGGEWTRVFVPATESAVSVTRYDPEAREFLVDRYLLDREAMTSARTARAAFEVPACGGGEEAARTLGAAQGQILAGLPATPNERLVYRCSATDSASEE